MAVRNKTINRDISWLSFNERVLQEAFDKNVPLVERMRFLGIFSNNLDEFFKVRVATIKRMIDLGYDPKQLDGENPKKTIINIQEKVIQMQNEFTDAFETIISDFEKENIFLINEKQLNEEQSKYIDDFFDSNILPFLSPIMLGNIDKFPYLKDKSIYFAIKLTSNNPEIPVEYALMEIPSPMINRVILLPSVGGKKYIIFIDDAIRYCLKDLFSIFNYDHFEAFTIKLTRDAELDIDNDLSKSFLEKISEGVSDRSKGQPVRFVYDKGISQDMFDYIIKRLQFDNYDTVIPGGRYHNFKDFMSFPNIGGQHLEYKPAPSIDYHLIKRHESMIELISKRDIMLHFPYHKFNHFVDFLREASMDPKVKTIKITLYRVAKNSKVINALINASRNGKQVIVVFELQARFDEKANIYWSKKLEEVGVTILFGIKGLKVHCKLVQVIRKEGKTERSYSVISTGNFHEGNTNVYTDVALFTSDKRITADVDRMFQFFDNPYWNYDYKNLQVSPIYMRKKLIKLIDNEIKNAKTGKDAYILLKINNLVDNWLVKKLYEANNAGVKIKLLVRGICCIRPGVKGFSENIEASSIVDRFLEHSRIFVFCNNNDELYFISSADWMTRNLDHRVEVTCPIYDTELKKELRMMLELQFSDNVKSRILNENQDNKYLKNDGPPIHSQTVLYDFYKRRLMESN